MAGTNCSWGGKSVTENHPSVVVGTQAPDFTAQTPLHGAFTLSQALARSPVAVVFFRAFATGNRLKIGGFRLSRSLCPTCQLMLVDLSRHYERIRELGAEVAAVSTVQLQELDAVIKMGEPKFPICADADAAIVQRYGVYDTLWRHPKPAAFLIDRQGVIRYRHIAEQQTDLPRAEELVEHLASLVA